jgi:hypothetical protein
VLALEQYLTQRRQEIDLMFDYATRSFGSLSQEARASRTARN